LGVTRGGKSTLGNALVGCKGAYEVVNTLESCTSNEIATAEGFLFGELSSGLFVKASDTGGLGDTEGRGEEFTDNMPAQVCSVGGAHGFVYVHNACEMRLSGQAHTGLWLPWLPVSQMNLLEKKSFIWKANSLPCAKFQCIDALNYVPIDKLLLL
jgi:hypothetical protein